MMGINEITWGTGIWGTGDLGCPHRPSSAWRALWTLIPAHHGQAPCTAQPAVTYATGDATLSSDNSLHLSWVQGHTVKRVGHAPNGGDKGAPEHTRCHDGTTKHHTARSC